MMREYMAACAVAAAAAAAAASQPPLPRPPQVRFRRGRTAMEKLRIVRIGFGTARQETVLE
jgi:hypothetical protein